MDPNTLAVLGGAGTIFGIGLAVFERLRKNGISTQISIAKDELCKVLSSDRDAWKSRHESEHAEFLTYREATHTTNNAANAKILVLTDENAQLRAKTDITPLLEHQRTQGEINTKLVRGLDLILERLDGKHQHSHE